MAVSHVDADQRAYGPQNHALPGSPVQYFINPIGIQSIILSATELGPDTVLTTDHSNATSVNANLLPRADSPARIIFPLVQGMGFVTGVYTSLQPAIQSSVFFRNVDSVPSSRPFVFKYRIALEDGKIWLLYAMPSNGQDPQLSLVSSTMLQGLREWSGIIQVAKNPAGSAGEMGYDRSAGVYATTATITGSTSGSTGTYQIQWAKAGITFTQTQLLMYALPHHIQSFGNGVPIIKTSIQLQTSTKGMATAIIADGWTLVEPSLPTDIGFAPWSPSRGSMSDLSAAALDIINQTAHAEINQDMYAQTDLDSMYFSGKALSKFATLVYTVHDLCREPNLAFQGLEQLKGAFARFVDNRQKFPLVYDTVWKGVVSSGTYLTGDAGQDFGNTFYNDHHFHYGYFIHAAAIIAYLDPNWLALNKDWVQTLVRDTSNPVQDGYFPFSRAFDWYHGHSFAKGLFESADSKDEESSSEDAFFAYALKMWGNVIGDASMEARGNLMLAILARTLNNYFLMSSDNVNQPANFIGNKVTGIVSGISYLICSNDIPLTFRLSSSKTKSTTPPTSAPTPNTSKGKPASPHSLPLPPNSPPKT